MLGWHDMQTRYVFRRPRRKEPVLWIVDSEQWPRACLRAELIERGYDAYGFISLSDAIDTLSRQISPKPDAFIFELRDQNFTKEMLETVRTLKIPTILLAGATELTNPLIQKYNWTKVLKRPFSLGTIADLIQQLLPEGTKG
jgi:hypothetical protein